MRQHYRMMQCHLHIGMKTKKPIEIKQPKEIMEGSNAFVAIKEAKKEELWWWLMCQFARRQMLEQNEGNIKWKRLHGAKKP